MGLVPSTEREGSRAGRRAPGTDLTEDSELLVPKALLACMPRLPLSGGSWCCWGCLVGAFVNGGRP